MEKAAFLFQHHFKLITDVAKCPRKRETHRRWGGGGGGGGGGESEKKKRGGGGAAVGGGGGGGGGGGHPIPRINKGVAGKTKTINYMKI